MTEWPTITRELEEQLEVLRYLARDPRCRSIYGLSAFKEVDKDFDRILKMKRLGKELKPGSYKRLTIAHRNHGTDAWEIRISASRSQVIINKDNWKSFCYWVERLRNYAPNSAGMLMEKYPHVRVETWKP